jgi:hypothetical protein
MYLAELIFPALIFPGKMEVRHSIKHLVSSVLAGAFRSKELSTASN